MAKKGMKYPSSISSNPFGGFDPFTTVNYAGDPEVEDRVVTEVASYGRQLGWLMEIIIALAKQQAVPMETLKRLEQEKIEAVKRSVHRSALDEAQALLDRLERDQPEAYQKLLAERQQATQSSPKL